MAKPILLQLYPYTVHRIEAAGLITRVLKMFNFSIFIVGSVNSIFDIFKK
jgi:hypothetical protein